MVSGKSHGILKLVRKIFFLGKVREFYDEGAYWSYNYSHLVTKDLGSFFLFVLLLSLLIYTNFVPY